MRIALHAIVSAGTLAFVQAGGGNNRGRGRGPPINISAKNPSSNIAAAARTARSTNAAVHISGLVVGTDTRDYNLIATTSIDPAATYTSADGTKSPVSSGRRQLLVSAEDEAELIILSTDANGDGTRGLIQHGGRMFGVSQKAMGRPTETAVDSGFEPPPFACSMDALEQPSGGGPGGNGRRLDEKKHGHDNHHGHDHSHGHGHDHDHIKKFDNMLENLQLEGLKLRGTKSRLGRQLYYTDTYPQAYSFQVDLRIEHDKKLKDECGGQAEVEAYIDTLVSGANIVFEKEVDTHLNVIEIVENSSYNSMNDPGDALDYQMATYAGSKWPNSNPDLIHSLHGNDLGGGVAYLSVVCNKNYGFGVSGSLAGSTGTNAYDINYPSAMVWDIIVFMHELGHNFGSGHSHDEYDATNDPSGYSPKIDECGISCSNAMSAGLAANSATIMSYCHLCGITDTIAHTFGGNRVISGSSVTWQDNTDKLVGSFSDNPSRIPEKMYNHVSSRNCDLAPPVGSVPPQFTTTTAAPTTTTTTTTEEPATTTTTTTVAPTTTTTTDDPTATTTTADQTTTTTTSNPTTTDPTTTTTTVESTTTTTTSADPTTTTTAVATTTTTSTGGSSSCPSGKMKVALTITTDYWPWETTWKIVTSTGEQVAAGGPYGEGYYSDEDKNTDILIDVGCLDDDYYQFRIFDSYGDGIGYGGGYTLSVDGVEEFSVNNFRGTVAFHDFMICPAGLELFQMEMQTDFWGEENSMKIKNGVGQTVWKYPPSGEALLDNWLYSFMTCLPPQYCYNLIVTDSFGDGIVSPGYYRAEFSRNEFTHVKNDFVFTSKKDQFGSSCGTGAMITEEMDLPAYVSPPGSTRKIPPQGFKKLTKGQKRAQHVKAEKQRIERIEKKMKELKEHNGKGPTK